LRGRTANAKVSRRIPSQRERKDAIERKQKQNDPEQAHDSKHLLLDVVGEEVGELHEEVGVVVEE
jgi:hypothetical protein